MAQYYEFTDFHKLLNQIHDNERITEFEFPDLSPDTRFVSYFMSAVDDLAAKKHTEAAYNIPTDEPLPYTHVTVPLLAQSYLKNYKQTMENNQPQLRYFLDLNRGLIPASLVFATAKGIQGLRLGLDQVKQRLDGRMTNGYVSFEDMTKQNMGLLIVGEEIQYVFPGKVAEVQG